MNNRIPNRNTVNANLYGLYGDLRKYGNSGVVSHNQIRVDMNM